MFVKMNKVAALIAFVFARVSFAAEAASPDFNKAVQPILNKYCNACHNSTDKEGKLVLDSYDSLLKGGKRGGAIVAGKADASRLIRVLEGAEPKMPPEGNDPPKPEELALLKAWINAGASGPSGAAIDSTVLIVPDIQPTKQPVRRPITALTFNLKGDALAIGRYGTVEVIDPATLSVQHRLSGIRGQVNEVRFTPDNKLLIAAGGEPGLVGEIAIWKLTGDDPESQTKPLLLRGHRDSIYALALSADGRLLASGSYDHSILLWDVASGKELRPLQGHNGAIFSLAFARGDKLLASASADRTIKLWNPATGERVDTFGQANLDQYAVCVDPRGERVAAAGGDNRVRVWQLSANAAEGSNTLVHAKFAHEQPLIKLLWSPDGKSLATASEDRRVKILDADTITERKVLHIQPDAIGGLAWSPDSKRLAVGCLDGTLALYKAAVEKEEAAPAAPKADDQGSLPQNSWEGETPAEPLYAKSTTAKLRRPKAFTFTAQNTNADETKAKEAKAKESKPVEKPKPELISISPRAIQRGVPAKIMLRGKNLAQLDKIESIPSGGIFSTLEPGESETERQLSISTSGQSALGTFELELFFGEQQLKSKVSLIVDTIPQHVQESNENTPRELQLPCSISGKLAAENRGQEFVFDGQQGDSLVFDLAHRQPGGKGNFVLTITGPDGKQHEGTSADEGEADPLRHLVLPMTGRYTVRIQELALLGGEYRLSVGAFPFVTGAWPLCLPGSNKRDVYLLGFNLPQNAKAHASFSSATGDAVVVVNDPYRKRTAPTILVINDEPQLEQDRGARNVALHLRVPGSIAGRLEKPGEVDEYRFKMDQGQTLIFETLAATRGSPVDTTISIHTLDGQPVPRVLLQAVRDSFINFRGINSSITGVRLKNWEEMELNEFVYCGGEVNRIFRMPQGPDSDFIMYEARDGVRRAYFDTTATAHANYDAAYTVEAHPPGTKLSSNGLPTFTLNYQNDDAGERERGTDSRLTFTAPATGEYVVRVTDTRGAGSPRHVYHLFAREPKPDFKVTLNTKALTIPRGSGRELNATVERSDGFTGEIKLELQRQLPEQITWSGPVTIQANQRRASSVFFAELDAKDPANVVLPPSLTATAIINGKEVVKEVATLEPFKLQAKPKLRVEFAPANINPEASTEIILQPGRSVNAKLKILRDDFTGPVTLDVLNLPHGVIVDNIGLNAVLLLAGETEREITLTASSWVTDLDRPIFAVAKVEGNLCSQPLTLRVRKSDTPGAKRQAAATP
jgi:WD40 repeat protein